MRAKVQRSGLPGSRLTTAITTTVGMTLTLIMVGTIAVLALLGRTWERQLRQEARIQVYFEVEGDTASLAWASGCSGKKVAGTGSGGLVIKNPDS